jgi:protein-disulfide isomerase
MKSRITVGLLMSALLLPAAVLAETKRCTPKYTEGDTIIELADCKVLSAEEIQKSAIEDISTNFGGMHPVINAKGSVTLAAVYDYACSDCKKMAPRLLTLAKNHPDIRVIFRNTQGESPNARLAAQAETKVWILQGEKAFTHYFSQLCISNRENGATGFLGALKSKKMGSCNSHRSPQSLAEAYRRSEATRNEQPKRGSGRAPNAD